MCKMGSLVTWPFVVIWRLLSFVFELTGRLVAFALGFLLLLLGVLVSLTGIGALVGIPVALVGFLLLARAVF